MFTRHLFAAAALMAATFSAHADVIATSPDALASSSVIANATVSSASLASNMSIVDGGTTLSGAGTGLASILASSNSTARLYLVRGVEGLYMLASRFTGEPDAIETGAPAETVNVPVPAAAEEAGTPPPAAADGGPLVVDADPIQLPSEMPADLPNLPVQLPVLEANDVPEPSSIALMLAGMIGAVGIQRARKQG